MDIKFILSVSVQLNLEPKDSNLRIKTLTITLIFIASLAVKLDLLV